MSRTLTAFISLVIVIALPTAAYAHHDGASVGAAAGGPIQSLDASTLPKGAIAVAMRDDRLDLDRLSDVDLVDLNAKVHHPHSLDAVSTTTLSVSGGVTDRVTLGVRFSHVSRDDVRTAHSHGGPVFIESEGDSDGFGDSLLYVRWKAAVSEARRVAFGVFAGIETPTGETNERSPQDERYEPDHQPGSGSWDPWVGLAVSKDWERQSLHGSVFWQGAGDGSQESNLGDGFSAAVAYVLAIRRSGSAGSEHPTTGGSIDFVSELLWETRERSEVDGEKEEHGGTIAWFSPGFRFGLGGHWSGYVSACVPVAQDPRAGDQDADWRGTAGVSVVVP